MNDRIKELILKAGWKNAYVNPKEGFEVVFEDEEHNLACIEKFAELIVRECLSYTKDGDIDFMKFMIRKHFGVE